MSSPDFCRVAIPGPSLHPPIPCPPIQMLGMEVRPVLMASDALNAIPSLPIWLSSRAVYLTPASSKIFLALTQKGHELKLNTITGFEAMSSSTFFPVASSLKSEPACNLAKAALPFARGEFWMAIVTLLMTSLRPARTAKDLLEVAERELILYLHGEHSAAPRKVIAPRCIMQVDTNNPQV
jgi:hypothetical protein